VDLLELEITTTAEVTTALAEVATTPTAWTGGDPRCNSSHNNNHFSSLWDSFTIKLLDFHSGLAFADFFCS